MKDGARGVVLVYVGAFGEHIIPDDLKNIRFTRDGGVDRRFRAHARRFMAWVNSVEEPLRQKECDRFESQYGWRPR